MLSVCLLLLFVSYLLYFVRVREDKYICAKYALYMHYNPLSKYALVHPPSQLKDLRALEAKISAYLVLGGGGTSSTKCQRPLDELGKKSYLCMCFIVFLWIFCCLNIPDVKTNKAVRLDVREHLKRNCYVCIKNIDL